MEGVPISLLCLVAERRQLTEQMKHFRISGIQGKNRLALNTEESIANCQRDANERTATNGQQIQDCAKEGSACNNRNGLGSRDGA